MSVIHLYRGHHSASFASLFRRCYEAGELLITCPPTDLDWSFLHALPEGELAVSGDLPRNPERPPEDSAAPAPAYPERPVLGTFTSGTTPGGQKLVLYSRKNIEASQRAIWALFDDQRVKQVFCYPQPYHVFGLLLGYALAQDRGRRLVFADGPYSRSSHAAWLGSVSSDTLTLATPSHLTDLCSYLTLGGICPPASYSAILGGARVDVEVWRKARDVARIEAPSVGYGATEASPGVTHLPPGVEPAVDGDVGHPLSGVSLDWVADGASYVFSGDNLCLAAIERGELTFPRRHEVRDRLGAGPDGRLLFRGRSDLVLNRGGEKFPLERIEALLKDRHGIAAICVALPHPRLGEELGIVMRAGAEATTEQVFRTLEETFQRGFDPALAVTTAELPLSANAKPDRTKAAALISSRPLR